MFDEQKPDDTRPIDAGRDDGARNHSGRVTVHAPEFQKIRSKYEFVMAAAKESERLNDRHRNDGFRTTTKVTVEAIDRIRKGLSRIAYEEPQAQTDEVPKESTYFFGS